METSCYHSLHIVQRLMMTMKGFIYLSHFLKISNFFIKYDIVCQYTLENCKLEGIILVLINVLWEPLI